MLKNIFRTFYGLTVALMTILGVTACSDDSKDLNIPQEQYPEAGFITLNLNCVEGTRATETEDGVESYNENLIKTVTLCLWADDGTKPDATAKPDYVQTFTSVDAQNSATLRIPLTETLKRVLFESDPAKCNVFAAVNVNRPDGEFTIAEFRTMTIDSEFSNRRIQGSFAMDGDGVVTYDRINNVATGSIPLQRAASKISLALSVDTEVTQSVVVDGALISSKWRPDTYNMRVWLNGALAESTLDPDLTAKPGPAYFFNTPDNLTYTFDKNTDNPHKAGKYTYDNEQDVPFYTYPHSWSAEPGDHATTYMTLAIPWMRINDDGSQVAGSSWRTCYYQVPVISENSDPLQLVRNVAYHIYLHVGLLGSFVPDEPLLLEDLEYSVAEWGNVNMDVKIPDVRYLVVDQNDYTVNNESSITIPFYTSHETVVTDATMTFYRYNFDDVGSRRTVTVSMKQNDESALPNKGGAPVFTVDFDNKTSELKVFHELKICNAYSANDRLVSYTNNDGPNVGRAERMPQTDNDWKTKVIDNISYFKQIDEDEYTPVEFKITLQHKDMKGTTNFSEVITITQYPGMYITAVQNYCPTNTTSFSYTGAQGNTFINGCYTDLPESLSGYLCGDDPSLTSRTQLYQGVYSTQYYGWCTSIGLESVNLNFNPNMYLVTVTTLSEEQGKRYRIGDPRSSYINNYLEDGTSSGSNNPLPTGEDTRVWTNNITSTYIYKRWGSNVTARAKGFVTAAAIEGGKRRLQYYYPTLETTANKMMIAPKFRICSSYAGTSWILNRELARRRAAAYQEMGYPAGRWRLPTYGEVAFIMELAAQYKIPRLFGTFTSTWWYWCANGLVTVPAKSTGNGPSIPDNASGYIAPTGVAAPVAQRARFVYDEWYWGEEDLEPNGVIGSQNPVYTFTWGDKKF